MFNISRVGDKNIYLVSSESSEDLARLFMRFQECYESPKFRGKVFSRMEFIKYYESEVSPTNNFSYTTDWAGFNVPDSTIEFVRNNFKDLSEEETELFNMIDSIHKEGKYYVIGAAKDDILSMVHEVCHALYYIDDDYKTTVDGILKTIRQNKFKTHLRSMGYCENVIMDEIHAYLMTREYPSYYQPTKNDKKMIKLLAESTLIQSKLSSTLNKSSNILYV